MKVIDYDKFIGYLDYLLTNDHKPDTVIGKAYREGALFATEMIRRRAVVMAEEMPETIVRCKDCKHLEIIKGHTICQRIKLIYPIMKPTDFCSYGERRESE